MSRKDDLIKIFENVDPATKSLVIKLIDDAVFLETQLESLRKYPFIKIHPKQPEIQKPTVASKQYKELLQQYNNIVKLLCSILHKDDSEEGASPLREYMKRFNQ